MVTTTDRMTAEQYFATSVEGDRMQLVDGVMVLNEATYRHQLIQGAMLFELMSWIRAAPGRGRAVGPVDVVVSGHDVYGPDLVWIAEANLPADPTARLERIPDLCVEIRSASTWRFDVGRKLSSYEAAGLPELWLVDDRSETVLVYRRSRAAAPAFDVALELGGDAVMTSPQLPGFSLPVGRVFAG